MNPREIHRVVPLTIHKRLVVRWSLATAGAGTVSEKRCGAPRPRGTMVPKGEGERSEGAPPSPWTHGDAPFDLPPDRRPLRPSDPPQSGDRRAASASGGKLPTDTLTSV